MTLPNTEDYKRDWSPWGMTANPLNYRISVGFSDYLKMKLCPSLGWSVEDINAIHQVFAPYRAWLERACRRENPTPWPKAGKHDQ